MRVRAALQMTAEALSPLPLGRSTAAAVLNMVFQPIIDLRTEGVVGYEALARGPHGSPWERPDDLFAQARLEGRLREMDWACRVAAMRDVRACAPARPPWRLFLNSEPEVLGTLCPEELLGDWLGGTGELEVVVEVTERALAHGPRRLIAAVEELRGFGCEIALDDVGANEASVALLPLIEPDVVKLDAGLLRPPHGDVAQATLRAVTSYVERTDAVLVAEGIETPEDRARAVAIGAQWGQGFLFARPRRLAAADVGTPATGSHRATRGASPAPRTATPDAPTLIADAAWVVEHLRSLVLSARDAATMNVLLMALPDPALAPEGCMALLAALQESCALMTVVLGEGPSTPAARLRRSAPVQDDVVAILLGPYVSTSVVATCRDDGRYDVVLDESPAAVAAAAREFLARTP